MPGTQALYVSWELAKVSEKRRDWVKAEFGLESARAQLWSMNLKVM